MDSIEQYTAKADELAQFAVNAWGVNVEAGNSQHLTAEFKVVLNLACNYIDQKRVVENHRKFGGAAVEEENKLAVKKSEFIERYLKFYQEKSASV